MQIKALREDELDESFFQALSHVQEIHSNCKLLLRTHHQVTYSETSSKLVFVLRSEWFSV